MKSRSSRHSPLTGAAHHLELRRSITGEAGVVSSVLAEAAAWVRQRGSPLWSDADVAPEALGEDVDAGLYVLASAAGSALGVMRLTPSDPRF